MARAYQTIKTRSQFEKHLKENGLTEVVLLHGDGVQSTKDFWINDGKFFEEGSTFDVIEHTKKQFSNQYGEYLRNGSFLVAIYI